MPDSITPPERRSAPTTFSRGLPILSTERLTFAEREALRALARALRVAADLADAALAVDRVDHALQAGQTASEIAQAAATLTAWLGSNR
jgi:hypothetical protein